MCLRLFDLRMKPFLEDLMVKGSVIYNFPQTCDLCTLTTVPPLVSYTSRPRPFG